MATELKLSQVWRTGCACTLLVFLYFAVTTPKLDIIDGDNLLLDRMTPTPHRRIPELTVFLEEQKGADYMPLYPYLRDSLSRRLLFECVEGLILTNTTCRKFSTEILSTASLVKKNLSALFQLLMRDISRIQFPSTLCESQRYMVIPILSETPWSISLQKIRSAISEAYNLNRVAVLASPYVHAHYLWSSLFEPISNCQSYYWSWRVAKAAGVAIQNQMKDNNFLGDAKYSLTNAQMTGLLEGAKARFSMLMRVPTSNESYPFLLKDDSAEVRDLDTYLAAMEKPQLKIFHSLFDTLLKETTMLNEASYTPLDISIKGGIARKLLYTPLNVNVFDEDTFQRVSLLPIFLKQHVNEYTLTVPDVWYHGVVINWIFGLKNDPAKAYIEAMRRENVSEPPLAAICSSRGRDVAVDGKSPPSSAFLNKALGLVNMSNAFEKALVAPYTAYVASKIEMDYGESSNFRMTTIALPNETFSNEMDEGAPFSWMYNYERMAEARVFVGAFERFLDQTIVELKHAYIWDPMLYSTTVGTFWTSAHYLPIREPMRVVYGIVARVR